MTIVMLNHRTDMMEAQPDVFDVLHVPLDPKELAQQFERNATVATVKVSVTDVRYSLEADNYPVNFSWTDSASNASSTSQVFLRPDGYGVYEGYIRDNKYLALPGKQQRYRVAVKTPSPLSQ